jgi:hypothetical protein
MTSTGQFWLKAHLLSRQPDKDCLEGRSAAISKGEFVVARCQSSPLLGDIKVRFDDTAAFGVLLIEDRRSAPGGSRRFRWLI